MPSRSRLMPAASRDFTVPIGIEIFAAISEHDMPSKYDNAALIRAERREHGAHARMIGARFLGIIGHDLEAGIAGIPRYPRGFLMIEGSRAHTYSQPGTNSTALWIEVFGTSPRLEEDVM